MRRGITLIELITVIAISTIVLATGLISFTSVERKILYQASQELKLELDLVRYLALFYGTRHDIWLLDEDDRLRLNADFQIIRRYNCWYTSRPRVYVVRNGWLPSGVEVFHVTNPHNQRFLGYTSRGTAIYAGSVTLATENYYVRMTVNVGSGFVSIGDIEPRM